MQIYDFCLKFQVEQDFVILKIFEYLCENKTFGIMNLEADIKWITKELQKVKDPDFLGFIKTILQGRKEETQKESISIDEYNREIEEADKDIETGNFYTSQEVEKMMSQWGRK